MEKEINSFYFLFKKHHRGTQTVRESTLQKKHTKILIHQKYFHLISFEYLIFAVQTKQNHSYIDQFDGALWLYLLHFILFAGQRFFSLT